MREAAPPVTDASSARSLRSLGLAARQGGDHVRALAHFQAGAVLNPEDPHLQQEIGASQLALGHVAAAEEAYRSALARKADLVDAVRGLGHCARRRGDRALALTHFEHAQTLSDNHRIGFEVAAERVALGETAEAAYRTLLDHAQTRPSACVEIARHLRSMGELRPARAWLEQAVAAEPGHRDWRLGLADLLSQSGALGEASAIYADLLAGRPADVDALLGLGALRRRQGARDEALSLFEAAWTADPRRGVIELARECRDQGAHQRALDLLEEARTGNPGDASIHVQLGLAARAAAHSDMAIRHFQAALGADPKHLSAHLELATDLRRAGRIAEAAGVLSDAAALWPAHPRVLEARGDALLAADEVETALGFYRRATAGDPGQSSPRIKAAQCQAALGRADEALATLDATADALGSSPDLAIARARILKDRGCLAAASEAFREGMAAFPANFQLWLQSALFHIDWCPGDTPDGPRGATLAGTPAERAKAHLVPGAQAAARWNFAEAQHWFGRAAEHNPDDGAIRVRLAQAALAALDVEAAERHLRHLSMLEAPTKRLRGQSVGPFQSLLGQILEEALVDAEARACLQAAVAAPPDERLAALLAVVRYFPDVTLAGVRAMIELRRGGMLDRPSTLAGRDVSSIPAVIVQFWHAEDVPADVQALCETWRTLNPDCAYRRFSARDAAVFLATECSATVARAFARARDPAGQADLFRLAYLARHGGIYADVDDRCRAPLTRLREDGAALILYQEDLGSIGNNIIAAAPNHVLIQRALDLAAAAVDRGDCDIPWLSTGPGLLSRVVAQAVAEDGPASLAGRGVCILERRELLTSAATGCMTAYKHTRRHWSRAAFMTDRRRTEPGLPFAPSGPPTTDTKGNLRYERGSAFSTG